MSQIEEIASSVRSGARSALEYVNEAIERAEAAEEYHALLSLTTDRARERAKDIDERVKAGESVGRLAGVPFVAKDNMLSFGGPTTAAAKILENFEAPFQAEIIERVEAEGAILIGKANLDAFAHGGSTENSAFGPTLNPHDKSRVPGGSSGGSAAAVALDIVPFALGTDTGGSIRQPASFSGVVGFKPTYGTISRYGVVAMASSTDVMGPIAKTAADAALLMDILAGLDSKDSTTLPDFYQLDEETAEKYRFGIIKEWLEDGVDTGVKESIEEAIRKIKAAGHEVEYVSMPSFKYALAVYYIVVPAEIASNLARFDGVRYGTRDKTAKNLNELYTRSRESGFVAENKRRILIGNYVLSSGYYDAYYRKAQQVRTLIINEFNEALEKYDALIGPVVPTTAFKLGENTGDPLAMYLADSMTVTASLAGLPAVSVPVSPSEGLPVGLQIIGSAKSDRRVLAMAEMVEGVNK